MPTRSPVVANQFYPGSREALEIMLDELFRPFAGKKPASVPFIFMLPHAGYIFSGFTAAATLEGVRLPEHLVILCPNHTGYGLPFGVWPDGKWLTPLGSVDVDADMAARLTDPGLFEADLLSHEREHSIEVELPFLQHVTGGKTPLITPVCIGTQNPRALESAGSVLAAALREEKSTGILVSSDMNHYEDEDTTKYKDNLALEKVLAEEPEGLLDVCSKHSITMCGASPMALALFCLRELRDGKPASKPAELVMHDTSARAARDTTHVVGYAGVHIFA